MVIRHSYLVGVLALTIVSLFVACGGVPPTAPGGAAPAAVPAGSPAAAPAPIPTSAPVAAASPAGAPATAASPAPATSPAPAAASASGQTLVLGMDGEVSGMNPNHVAEGTGWTHYLNLYDNLVTYDFEKKQIAPMLAESWRVVDPLNWEFKLRRGVRFHNGQEFKAADVKFTIESMLADPRSLLRARIAPVNEVVIVDDYTVRINTKQPFVVLPNGLMQVYIYPTEYYQQVKDDGFAARPVGTGPFKFKEWTKGVSITLERNDAYWGNRPKVSTLVLKPFADPATKLAALTAGEVDIAQDITPDDVSLVKARGLNVEWTLLNRTMTVVMRRSYDGEAALPTADVRVRRALNYALDKEAIVNSLMTGYGQVARAQVTGPDCFGHNPDLPGYAYDPAKAKQLLAEAGYPDGFPIKFLSPTSGYNKVRDIAENVVGQLAKVGVKVDLELVDRSEFGVRTQANRAHPLSMSGINCFPSMDGDAPLPFYTSASTSNPPYTNEKIDGLFTQSRAEFDPTARLKVLRGLVAEMSENPTQIYMFHPPVIFGVNPRVKGFTATPDGFMHFDNVDVQR